MMLEEPVLEEKRYKEAALRECWENTGSGDPQRQWDWR